MIVKHRLRILSTSIYCGVFVWVTVLCMTIVPCRDVPNLRLLNIIPSER